MANERVKILGICACRGLAVQESLSAAKSTGYTDTEYIWLSDYEIKPCTGCMKCFGYQHPADGGWLG